MVSGPLTVVAGRVGGARGGRQNPVAGTSGGGGGGCLKLFCLSVISLSSWPCKYRIHVLKLTKFHSRFPYSLGHTHGMQKSSWARNRTGTTAGTTPDPYPLGHRGNSLNFLC